MNGFDFQPIINMGIAGVMLVWFMLRLERLLTRFDKTVQMMARAIIRLLERDDPKAASDLSKELHRANGTDDGDD